MLQKITQYVSDEVFLLLCLVQLSARTKSDLARKASEICLQASNTILLSHCGGYVGHKTILTQTCYLGILG